MEMTKKNAHNIFLLITSEKHCGWVQGRVCKSR